VPSCSARRTGEGGGRGASKVLVATLLALVALTLAGSPAAAQTASGSDAFTVGAEVQRALLERDRADYRAARRAEERAQEALDEALTAYDLALRPRQPALDDVETAAGGVASARSRLEIAAARCERLSEAIRERLRTLDVLAEGESVEAATVPPGSIDLTGRWRVAVSPDGLLGTFHLDQDGAVVTGTYTLTDGSGGSLRGSVAGERLRLDRIDRTSGFDAVYEATVDVAEQRIDGSWTPTILSSGGPGGGTWTAVPAGSAAAEDLEPPPADGLEAEELEDESVLDEDDEETP
jgi:hypothetical protein